MEPTKKARAVRSLAKQLQKLADRADALDLRLGNGGEVGALIGSMVDEIEARLEDGEFDL